MKLTAKSQLIFIFFFFFFNKLLFILENSQLHLVFIVPPVGQLIVFMNSYVKLTKFVLILSCILIAKLFSIK